MVNYAIENMYFSDINPLICGWEQCEKGHNYGPAVRNYHLIHYVLSGKGVFLRDSFVYNLGRGDMFLIRPDEVTKYTADINDPWQYVWIGFDGNAVERILSGTVFSDNVCTASAPALRPEFLSIKNSGPGTISLLSSLYKIMDALKPGDGPKTDYFSAAEGFIRANYSMGITVEDVADAAGIDRRYLYRIFIEKSGVSPKEYLTSLRLEKSRELLRQGFGVRECALSVGYTDQFGFSKMFSKKYGYPPVEERKRQ